MSCIIDPLKKKKEVGRKRGGGRMEREDGTVIQAEKVCGGRVAETAVTVDERILANQR